MQYFHKNNHSQTLQNACTSMGFQSIILIKELTSQQIKYGNVPLLMEFTDLTMLPLIWMQLAW